VYEPSRKGGAKSSIKIFSDDEEETLVSFCNIALEGTFGVSKEFVHELMWACARGATSRQRRKVSIMFRNSYVCHA